MRSMKKPLGIADPRVTMTDSPPDGLLSPSFASVLVFDDLPQHDISAPDEPASRVREMSPEARFATDKPIHGRGSGKRYPPLELDVAMDKFHTLDGFAEPLNPQNTPASVSGCDSPGEASRRGNSENLRTSSAPATQALDINWFDGQPEECSIFTLDDRDDDLKTQKRRFSADDQPHQISILNLKAVPLTANARHIKGVNDAISPPRCVRFSPPPDSPPRRSPRPIQRPLPSIERKQDYIATYRQQKQYEKWRSPNRARVQRVSPYRSPAKGSQRLSNLLNRQPDINFSSYSRLPFRADDRSRSPSPMSQPQDDLGQSATEMTGALLDDSALVNGVTPSQAYELAMVTFSLYRIQYPLSSRVSMLQVRVGSTILPVSTSPGQEGAKKDVQFRMGINYLIFHTYVMVPAFALRMPLVAVSAANRLTRSRIGLTILHIAKLIWLLTVRLINLVLLMLGLDVTYHSEGYHSEVIAVD